MNQTFNSSEPIASNFQVRGVTYQKDGMKVPSKEAIFALLGADNLTRTKGQDHECHTSLTPDSYLNKLRVACKKKGIQTPFVYVKSCLSLSLLILISH